MKILSLLLVILLGILCVGLAVFYFTPSFVLGLLFSIFR